jgi:hypothetical protein
VLSGDSETRRPAAAPASRPAAGTAATLRTPGDVQRTHQDRPRRHEDTKFNKLNDLRDFVSSWLIRMYAEPAIDYAFSAAISA